MEYNAKKLISRVLREYVKPRLGKIMLAVAFMLVYAGANAAQPLLLKYVFDDVFTSGNELMQTAIPLAIIAVFLVTGVSNYGSTVTMNIVGYDIVNDMQKRLFRHLVYSDLELFHKKTSGELISRIMNDIALIRTAVSTVIIGFFKQFFTFFGMVAVMFYTNWELSLIAFSVMLIIIYPISRVAKRLRKLARQHQSNAAVQTAKYNEAFKAMRVIKAYQKEEFEIERVNSVVDYSFRNRVKSVKIGSINSPLMYVLAGLAVAAVIWYTTGEIISGKMTQGDLVAFLTALLMASRPLKTMGGISNILQNAIVAAERYFQLIDFAPKIIDKEGAEELKVESGAIEFKNVSFSYDGKSNALESLSLTIPAGKKVALVGPSGSGKSTVMNLLLRFFDPQNGWVLVDGNDISNVTLSSLRRNISIVSQDILLFDDTIMENIRYGRADATDDEVMAAASAAYVSEFVADLPQGFHTVIGENGLLLSGGQKQRISIARAILRNAPILLLDEATSALDNVSEKVIQNALDSLMKNRTTLVIAHRLSTIINSDIIYVLDKGQVAASGTHGELLKNSPVYAGLYGGII